MFAIEDQYPHGLVTFSPRDAADLIPDNDILAASAGSLIAHAQVNKIFINPIKHQIMDWRVRVTRTGKWTKNSTIFSGLT